MTDTTPVEAPQRLADLLRNVPVQERARVRLETIRDAAKAAYAEKGRDRFTTDDVAERAGCSIGTIYRYFKDRVAIMDDIEPQRDAAQGKLVAVEEILKDSSEPNPRARIRAAVAVIDS